LKTKLTASFLALAAIMLMLGSQVAVADQGVLEWSGPLKYGPPEGGNIQLRIRHDSDGAPVLGLFKASIPFHCDNDEIGLFHYSYDPDDPRTKVTFRHVQVDGHRALAFDLYQQWGSGNQIHWGPHVNRGDGQLFAEGTLVLEGGGGGKDPDGQGKLAFHRAISPEKGQQCLSYGGTGGPMVWQASRKAL
jgi:hypothetical protein